MLKAYRIFSCFLILRFYVRFKIRDLETSTTLFEIAKPVGSIPEDGEGGGEAEPEAGEEEKEDTETEDEEAANTDEVDSNAGRFVRYQFTPQVSHSENDLIT
jgi:protein unc-119